MFDQSQDWTGYVLICFAFGWIIYIVIAIVGKRKEKKEE